MLGALIFLWNVMTRYKKRGKMKRLGFRRGFLFPALTLLFLLPSGAVIGQDTAEVSKKAEEPAPGSELDSLKAEWEIVREQQIQMIREKEDQLEKLKEEIFSKMKALSDPAISGGSLEFEAQKAAFQAERQKFFVEMSRQKESLRQLQSALDEKAKQLEAERDRFEQEKKTVASQAS